ncbi:hypothetical protein [Parasulfitobacter algicola]|uniref:NADH dehydrogenase subunit E n=1 Tax=Parasulfitobacter algicola TaxID=2614809 RepID=A0ABX2IUK0_9RHOB|nr:hypothetical protein [Sulfitobacter algicola]NSX54517.1 hypothetical protein [Sulfitobacter algicola]
MLLGDWLFIQAAFVAFLIFFIAGGLLSWVMLKPLPGPNEVSVNRAGQAPTVGDAIAAKPVSDEVVEPAAPTPRPAAAKRTVERAAAQAAKLDDTSESEPVVDEPAEKPAAKATPVEKAKAPKPETPKPVPAKKTVTKKPPAKKAATKKPAAKKPAAETEKAVSADGKPEFMKAARKGGPDDLKQIKGIGPKLEKLLHSMGVFHFDQIGGWRKKEVEWVDQNLEGFKGRVTRDEWVKQAKLLAKGEQTEFSKKVKKGDVY